MPLEQFFGEAVAIDTPKGPGEYITPEDFAGEDIRPGDIVLFRTGWEARSGTTAFFEGDWPSFSPEAIDELITRKVKAIGGDIASADNPAGFQNGCPAHVKAMKAGLPIFEALNGLEQVAGKRFLFVGLPLKIEGGEASPIRAIAILE
jgi:kynurenine formamidase